jgi:hypothetical protein
MARYLIKYRNYAAQFLDQPAVQEVVINGSARGAWMLSIPSLALTEDQIDAGESLMISICPSPMHRRLARKYWSTDGFSQSLRFTLTAKRSARKFGTCLWPKALGLSTQDRHFERQQPDDRFMVPEIGTI